MINLNLREEESSLESMSSGEDVERFYDMLFEISNDIRHNILMFLLQKPERMTQIAKELELTSPVRALFY